MGTTRRQTVAWGLVLLSAVLLGAIILWAGGRARRNGLLPVVFISDNGERSSEVYLEIASTPSERQRGLMYRDSLKEDEGMLFIFPEEAERSFWMKNTTVHLDILFLGNDQKIQGIILDPPVLSTNGLSLAGIKSKYVIELPAGTVGRLALKVGGKAEFLGPIPRGVPDFKALKDAPKGEEE